jgi:MFS family permease
MRRRGAGQPPLLTKPFVLVMAASFATLTAIGVLLPTMPRYASGPIGAGDLGVGVIMGSPDLVAALAQPFAGRVGDRRGRRLLIVGGPAIVAVASFGYVGAGELIALLPLRLLSGVGEALFLVGAATVVNDLAPDERRGEAVSYYTLCLYAGVVVGPLLGDAVLDAVSYDAVWALAGISALAASLVCLPVAETRTHTPPPQARRRGIVHPAALGPGFVLVLAMLGFGGFNTFVALYALEVGVDDPGVVFALFALIVVAVRLFGARIPDRLGAARTATLALVGLAIGLSVIGLWSSALGLYTGTVVFALGQSLAFPALMVMAVQRAPAAERSSVVGSFTMFFAVSVGSGAVALGAVASVTGYRGVFFVAAAGAVVALPLLLTVAGQKGSRAAAPPAAAAQPPA